MVMDRKLEFNADTNCIVLYHNNKCVRYTNVSYLPDGWQGLSGEKLIQWGRENNPMYTKHARGEVKDRLAWLVFELYDDPKLGYAEISRYAGKYVVVLYGFQIQLDTIDAVASFLNYRLGSDIDYVTEVVTRHKDTLDNEVLYIK